MGFEWVLVWIANGGDFYAGETAGLYRDGAKVWEGSSCDAAEDIVKAVLGENGVEVRHVGSQPVQRDGSEWYYFPRLLGDLS